jgi:hypothetical protein
MPVWLKEKLLLKELIQKNWFARKDRQTRSSADALHRAPSVTCSLGLLPSPFRSAAVLCLDGVGEWATTSAWLGRDNSLTPLWEIRFPHSLGLLYSAFTYYTGFKVNSGEYKVMGLAPYGEPRFVQAIYDNLLDLKPDGTFRMNMDYFDYCAGLHMTSRRFDALFGGAPRNPESKLTQREMDLARSVQDVTEEVMLRLARTLHNETGATISASLEVWPSTVSATVVCCAKAPMIASGSNRRRATPAAPSAQRCRPGTSTRINLAPSWKRPTQCGARTWVPRTAMTRSSVSCAASRRHTCVSTTRRCTLVSPGARAGKSRRLVSGANGIRSQGPRGAQHHW